MRDGVGVKRIFRKLVVCGTGVFFLVGKIDVDPHVGIFIRPGESYVADMAGKGLQTGFDGMGAFQMFFE
jgi:hypothetical protein